MSTVVSAGDANTAAAAASSQQRHTMQHNIDVLYRAQNRCSQYHASQDCVTGRRRRRRR